MDGWNTNFLLGPGLFSGFKAKTWVSSMVNRRTSNWVVVSNIFYFHTNLGKIPILTNIFQMGGFKTTNQQTLVIQFF